MIRTIFDSITFSGDNIVINNKENPQLLNDFIKATTFPTEFQKVKELIVLVDPFQYDKYGNSPFSISLRDGNINLAKWFIQTTKIDLWEELKNKNNIELCVYLAMQLGILNSNLAIQFGFNKQSTKVCFAEILECYDSLGEDSSDLLKYYTMS
jgi:hypothetical protein